MAITQIDEATGLVYDDEAALWINQADGSVYLPGGVEPLTQDQTVQHLEARGFDMSQYQQDPADEYVPTAEDQMEYDRTVDAFLADPRFARLDKQAAREWIDDTLSAPPRDGELVDQAMMRAVNNYQAHERDPIGATIEDIFREEGDR